MEGLAEVNEGLSRMEAEQRELERMGTAMDVPNEIEAGSAPPAVDVPPRVAAAADVASEEVATVEAPAALTPVAETPIADIEEGPCRHDCCASRCQKRAVYICRELLVCYLGIQFIYVILNFMSSYVNGGIINLIVWLCALLSIHTHDRSLLLLTASLLLLNAIYMCVGISLPRMDSFAVFQENPILQCITYFAIPIHLIAFVATLVLAKRRNTLSL